VAVDVHARKAVDQRAAGDLHLLQIGCAKLTRRKRLRQCAFGQVDQLSIVARYVRCLVVIEKPATGVNVSADYTDRPRAPLLCNW
jgi:hypothetical protein